MQPAIPHFTLPAAAVALESHRTRDEELTYAAHRCGDRCQRRNRDGRARSRSEPGATPSPCSPAARPGSPARERGRAGRRHARWSIPIDVADADAVFAAAERIEAELGPIDVWVNVAFTSVFAPFEQIKPEEYRRVTEVSYLGYVYATMAALEHMKPRDRGTIVQVGSALAYRGIPLQSAYCGAKHAIQGFHEALRCELLHDKSNVHVTMVQMPAVNTPQFSWVLSRLPDHAQPVPPIYQPEFAARGVLYAADHPRRREYWVGASTMGTLAANAIAPGLLDRYLGRTGIKSQQTEAAAAARTRRSICGSRPTGRTGTTSARTACSTPRLIPATRSCGPPSTTGCSAPPRPGSAPLPERRWRGLGADDPTHRASRASVSGRTLPDRRGAAGRPGHRRRSGRRQPAATASLARPGPRRPPARPGRARVRSGPAGPSCSSAPRSTPPTRRA